MKRYLNIHKQFILKNILFWATGLILPALFTVVSKVLVAKIPEQILTELDNGVVDIRIVMLIAGSLFIGSTIAEIVVSLFRIIIVKFMIDCEKEKKNEIFTKILKMRPQKYKELNTGEVILKYNKDVRASSAAISLDIEECIYPIIIGIGFCIAIMLRQIYVGLIVLAIIIAVTVFNWLFINKYKLIEMKLLQSKENYTQLIESSYSGKMMIRLLNLQDKIYGDSCCSVDDIAIHERKKIKLTFMKALSNDTLISLCSMMIVPLTCLLASFNVIKLPEVLFIANLCSSTVTFTGVLANSIIQFQKDCISLERIKPLLEIEQEESEMSNSGKSIKGNSIDSDEKCRIALRDVCINYSNKNILNNVSLNVYKGEIIALVGKSGSGKSSLIKSILQFNNYTGNIYIYNQNVLDLPVNQIRNNIAYIAEESDLFTGTIEKNVYYGDMAAESEDVVNAMEKAGLVNENYTIIDKNMQVGINGEQISGGLKQRVTIARGFLKKANIIIMDEPTSALDAIVENKVMSEIKHMAEEGKSIIFTSHRISTIAWASRIVMIKENEVIDNVYLEDVKKYLLEVDGILN